MTEQELHQECEIKRRRKRIIKMAIKKLSQKKLCARRRIEELNEQKALEREFSIENL